LNLLEEVLAEQQGLAASTRMAVSSPTTSAVPWLPGTELAAVNQEMRVSYNASCLFLIPHWTQV
jgi:hypothetical protein